MHPLFSEEQQGLDCFFDQSTQELKGVALVSQFGEGFGPLVYVLGGSQPSP